jgi:hypothetical protein
MSLTLQPVRVANGHDEEGVLVFVRERLLAVLVQLSDEHEEQGVAGRWFLETGYGHLGGPNHPTFPDLDAAQVWISERLGL